MIPTLLDIVVPVFLVIAFAAAMGRVLRLDLTSLNRVALYGAVPALVFTSLSGSHLRVQSVGPLLAGNLLYLIVMGALAWLASRNMARSSRRGFVTTSMFGNSANMMLPVTLFALGEPGLERALLLYVFTSVLLFSFGPLVLGGSVDFAVVAGKVARLPVLWAALLGLAFNLADASLPLGISRGVDLLASAAIPLVLLTLGLQIQKSGVWSARPSNWSAAGFKLLLGPVVGYLTGWLIGARGTDLAVLTLLAAMPPAVNNFMLALEFGGDAEEVAHTVILATLCALGSLSVVVWLLPMVT